MSLSPEAEEGLLLTFRLLAAHALDDEEEFGSVVAEIVDGGKEMRALGAMGEMVLTALDLLAAEAIERDTEPEGTTGLDLLPTFIAYVSEQLREEPD